MPTKRRPGRPRKFAEGSRRITVRLDEKEAAALEDFAERHFWSPPQAARLILLEKLLKQKLPKA